MRVPPAIAALPRFELLRWPSPFEPLPRFSAALGGGADIWIKREDLLPIAFGGNKLRNLEFLIGAALAQQADTLITGGRRWSNHCRLTAAAGARAGLAVHLVLTGPRPMPGDPPDLSALPKGCRFRPRCPYAFDACHEHPPAIPLPDGGHARCWLNDRAVAGARYGIQLRPVAASGD